MPFFAAVDFLSNNHRSSGFIRWGLAFCVLGFTPLLARGVDLESAGARYGFPAEPSARHFKEAEGFANWTLPWNWSLGKDWRLGTRLEGTAGWMRDRSADAFLGSVGPGLVLGWKKSPVSLAAGASPAVISRYDFPDKDIGTLFQIYSHVGLEWDLSSRVRLEYRYQHISNAGLDSNNPGLNMHMVGISYRF